MPPARELCQQPAAFRATAYRILMLLTILHLNKEARSLSLATPNTVLKAVSWSTV
ncbi:hypothetical protein I79_000394 [Cricetulus griseus]|uniref:Uncharacterized protein n=1 Tax=Cricetulus griseus TaxID=10029 RepID=G3GS80_CRIGR|nr:hypothetical protein I79_000394 [Cricetulus griseus]